MRTSKLQATLMITLIIVTGLSLSGKAYLSQTSEQSPTPGYIEQGVKITAEKYKFTLNELTFKAGTPITVILTSVGGGHSFAIDKLKIESREAEKGESVVFEFTVEEAGTYEFYCAHGSHKEKGMTGTLAITAEDQKP